MKLSVANSSRRRRNAATAARAFTIAELLTALAVFIAVIAALVTLQIVGMRMNARTASNMQSTAASLKVLNQVRKNVLQANSALVGNGSSGSFSATGTNGNALQVFSGTSTNNYLIFYVSTNTDSLYEWNSTNQQLYLLAANVTNQSVFESVDYQGNVSSGNLEHYSIRMTLDFAQLDYRAPTNTYEYYVLQTQMTPRNQ